MKILITTLLPSTNLETNNYEQQIADRDHRAAGFNLIDHFAVSFAAVSTGELAFSADRRTCARRGTF